MTDAVTEEGSPYWVWVTSPESYLDENGAENPALDPSAGVTWWTCDPRTRRGDLAVLYRSREAKDIAYRMRAVGDAYELPPHEYRVYGDMTHACDVEVTDRLDPPLTISELKSDDVIAEWPALRAAFVRGAAPVPPSVWARLMEKAKLKPLEDLGDVPESEHRLLKMVDRALEVQYPSIATYVDRLSERNTGASRDELRKTLERRYLAAMTGTGAAVGAAAAVPGVGTGASVGLGVGESLVSLEATAAFALSVARLYGVQVEDLQRQRFLLFSLLIGDGSSAIVSRIAGRTGKHWGRLLTAAVPAAHIRRVNKVLGQHFVTRYGTRQGILVIGRAAPFGIGAGIGAAGNAAIAWTAIRGLRRAVKEIAPPTDEGAASD